MPFDFMVKPCNIVLTCNKWFSALAVCAGLLWVPASAFAAEPCLARLSFWVPPEQKHEFEVVYDQQVAPFLEDRGFVASSEHGRATVDSVFSRLFEFDSPAAIAGSLTEKKRPVWQELRNDLAWQDLLKELGTTFGTIREDSLLKHHLGLYTTPAGPGAARLVGTGYQLGQWQSFGDEDGIYGAGALLEDRRGHLWFASGGQGMSRAGVVRYDGSRFTRFTAEDGLPNDNVVCMIEDRLGNLWFGTASYGFFEIRFEGAGVSRFDGNSFTTFTTADGLVHNDVRAMIQDRHGNIWFGTRAGLSRFDGTYFTTFTTRDGLAHNEVNSMLEDRDGNLWFGSLRSGIPNRSPTNKDIGGVSRYDGERFVTFDKGDGFAGNGVSGIVEDRLGNLWFTTWRDGVSKYDGTRFTTFAPEGVKALAAVLGADRHGNLWFVPVAGGLVRYNSDSFTTFTTQDGLAHDGPSSMMEDRFGNLWFGSAGGLSRYGSQFKTYNVDDGLVSSNVYKMLEDRAGNLWVASRYAGVSRFDGKQFVTFTTADGLAHNSVRAMWEDRHGHIWFGTWDGVTRYDGNEFTTYTTNDGLPHNLVWSIMEDREGRLLFGTGRGLGQYDGRTFTAIARMDSANVWCMLKDSNGNLWFADVQHGNKALVRFDGDGFRRFTTADGLAYNDVRSMTEDVNGRLWFGTAVGGVSRYDRREFVTFTTKHGLPGNNVWSALADRSGDLWFGAQRLGYARFDGTVFQTLSRKDGLASNFGGWDILEDKNGDIWFATEGGLTRYRKEDALPPTIHFTGVIADRNYDSVTELSLPSSQRFVTFKFQGRSMTTRPDGMVYRYRLQGFDDEWRQTRSREMEYTDLPRGRYLFQVQAVDHDLNYSEIVSVPLSIHLPYTRVAWISALSVAVFLAVWQTGRLVRRDRRLRETNDALAEANQAKSLFLANMSHEIRTPMNAILGHSQLLRRSRELSPDHRRAMETIQQSGDHLLKLINDVLDISKIEAGRLELSPADFDLRSMLETLGAMFELHCTEKGLQWRLEGVGTDAIPVYGDEDKLRQVLINLLGNAAKFTEAGEVTLRLIPQPDNRYRFEVTDTGPGLTSDDQDAIFEPFQQGPAGLRTGGTGLGLTIVQRQLELMGGQLMVDSTAGKGSCFAFVISLPPAQAEVPVEAAGDWARVLCLSPGFRVKALIADDVADNRDILAGMLAELGAEVAVVENGQRALEVLGAGDIPDILFLDIRMPVLGGLESIRLIRENSNWKTLKVVAISASVLDHERQEYLAAGFDDFVDKPFRFERVCACLSRHLRVEFEYGDSPAESSLVAENWEDLTLPADLRASLIEAAEVRGVTALEGHLKTLEQIGHDHRRLAEHLRQLQQQFQMDSVLEVVREIPVSDGPQATDHDG